MIIDLLVVFIAIINAEILYILGDKYQRRDLNIKTASKKSIYLFYFIL